MMHVCSTINIYIVVQHMYYSEYKYYSYILYYGKYYCQLSDKQV